MWLQLEGDQKPEKKVERTTLDWKWTNHARESNQALKSSTIQSKKEVSGVIEPYFLYLLTHLHCLNLRRGKKSWTAICVPSPILYAHANFRMPQ